MTGTRRVTRVAVASRRAQASWDKQMISGCDADLEDDADSDEHDEPVVQ